MCLTCSALPAIVWEDRTLRHVRVLRFRYQPVHESAIRIWPHITGLCKERHRTLHKGIGTSMEIQPRLPSLLKNEPTSKPALQLGSAESPVDLIFRFFLIWAVDLLSRIGPEQPRDSSSHYLLKLFKTCELTHAWAHR